MSITFKIRVAVTLLALAGVSACSATYRNHGYVPDDDELAEITVGVDSRDSVIELVGAPAVSGVLSDGRIYYIKSRVRHFGAMEPKVIDREVLAVSFDSANVVSNIERFTLEDGHVVPLSRRVTDTTIENKGFLRQLLGNIGNFNAATFLN